MPTHDVVIYGPTFSGCMAAVELARRGYDVGVVGFSPYKGGMITSGLGISDAMPFKTWWGPVEDFIDAVAAETGETVNQRKWDFPASIAQSELAILIAAESGITFYHNEYLVSVAKNDVTPTVGTDISGLADRGKRIVSITTDADTYAADHFIDASYEADLAVMAGVPTTYGRDSWRTYGEPEDYSDEPASSYNVRDDDGDLYDRAQHKPAYTIGLADRTVMAFGFRLHITDNATYKIAWPAPTGYDRNDFLDVIHESNARTLSISESHMGFNPIYAVDGAGADTYATNGSDLIGKLAWEWPRASHARRQEIKRLLAYRFLGAKYTLANDSAVPSGTRTSFSSYGLDSRQFATEYFSADGLSVQYFPWELYVRECRRIVGQKTVTAIEMIRQLEFPDTVMVGGYFLDRKASYQWQEATGTSTVREGDVDGAYDGAIYYGVPQGALVAARGVCDNLVTTCGASFSSLGIAAYRLEPLWGQAGVVAAIITDIANDSGTYAALINHTPVRAALVAAGAVLERY